MRSVNVSKCRVTWCRISTTSFPSIANCSRWTRW